MASMRLCFRMCPYLDNLSSNVIAVMCESRLNTILQLIKNIKLTKAYKAYYSHSVYNANTTNM